jgi:hypothetical protein
LSSCASDSDCVDSICSDTQCVEEKEAGEVCASDADCASGDCGGRCCESGTPCTCTQPSPENLIENPGFDTNLSGWTADAGSADVDHDDDNDVEGCPFSGSARLDGTASGQQRFAQCVNP